VPRSKNAWRYTSTPQYALMAWCLVKHRDNFTFYLYLYLLSSNILTKILMPCVLLAPTISSFLHNFIKGERIILKGILEKQDVRLLTRFNWLRVGSNGGLS
jgi:hypothetical protein